MSKCGRYSRNCLKNEIYQQVSGLNRTLTANSLWELTSLPRLRNNQLHAKKEDLFDVTYDLEKAFKLLLG